MLIHTNGGLEATANVEDFAIASALLHALVGVKLLHVAAHIDEARTAATWHARAGLAASALWLAVSLLAASFLGTTQEGGAARGSSSRALLACVWLAACLADPVATCAEHLVEVGRHAVPVSADVAARSYSGIYTSVLGAGAAIICRVNPLDYGVAQRAALRFTALLGFTIFINLKLVAFDVDTVHINSEHHATNKSKLTQVLWYASQPLLVMAAVVLTAGYGLLLDHPTDIPSTPPSRRGRVLTCWGLSALIFLLLVQRNLHGDDERARKSRRLRAIHHFQSGVYLVCAALSGWLPLALPAESVRGDRVNCYLAAITFSLVLSATADEFFEAYMKSYSTVARSIFRDLEDPSPAAKGARGEAIPLNSENPGSLRHSESTHGGDPPQFELTNLNPLLSRTPEVAEVPRQDPEVLLSPLLPRTPEEAPKKHLGRSFLSR
mmetsp:Transcript_11126/g.26119  ORF Transcript_11126/g.26119 Transcript_11126/m.26119 type:complete len:438 (+) Transcript_11126:687-2000(+)